MQLELFANDNPASHIQLEDLFSAYYNCRRTKRGTHNAIAFEIDYESNLVNLCDEINAGRYRPGKSIAFIVDKPVKREIFAADFRDRIVHHLIIAKLNPLFEKSFIFDSYACRVGKGTLFGIRRVERFIRQASLNYSQDAYILKLDIAGFFMSIDTKILYRRLVIFIDQNYRGADKEMLLELCKKVIFSRPVDNCIIRGSRKNWEGLPDNKSLFHAKDGCGIPIGNLSSQVFANFYLNIFDHFIKNELGIRYYGRYVDDFIIVHPSQRFLADLIPVIRNYLSQELGLELHPKKIYLQHYSHGVSYLGAIIKPGRSYVANRAKGNFYNSLKIAEQDLDRLPIEALDVERRRKYVSTLNSYLGLFAHHKSYRLRRKIMSRDIKGWWRYVYAGGGLTKVTIRKY
jgi:RNA-directed DNA polymerase